MIRFNDLLEDEGLLTEQVLLVRHRPSPSWRTRALRSAVVSEPAVFEAYQSSQGTHFLPWLKNVSYIASFFEDGAGRALFIGLYDVLGTARVSPAERAADPRFVRLFELGLEKPGEVDRATLDLARSSRLTEYSGRLLAEWHTRGQNWTHRASVHEMVVLAIHETNAFDPQPIVWDELDLSWAELATLASRASAKLAEWRGIYLIFDESDSKAYVGSACGEENLLGRWKNYADLGHGGNRLLRSRDPSRFRFSILQRLSPDMPREAVEAVEGSWKRRLHTRAPYGLNGN